MKVTLIRKAALSNDTNCPALYRTDRLEVPADVPAQLAQTAHP